MLFQRKENGQGMVEYALIIIIIAIVVIGIILAFSPIIEKWIMMIWEKLHLA